MPNILIVTAGGHIGRDASTREAGQTTVTSFPLAINTNYRDKDAPPTWLQVSVWGKRGEALAPHLTKGTAVLVSGRMTEREYQGKDGAPRRSLDVEASALEFLGGGGGTASPQSSTPAQDSPAAGADDDDIPF